MNSIKILPLFLFLLFTPQMQVDIEAQIQVKKCSVCDKPVNNCDYKGNHPKCKVCGKVKEKCPYQGNHPKCSTCGKYEDQCPYKGKHPLCDVCRKEKDKCQYKGNHPKCDICGEYEDQCPYKGKHPLCDVCGKVKDKCQYKGNHPICPTCGKLNEYCEYKGRHPEPIQKEIFTVKGVSFVMVKNVEEVVVTTQSHNNAGLNIPVNEIKVDKKYHYIGETEVTQELWQAVMGRIPSDIKSSYYTLRGNNHPVCYVNYYDCEKFIKTLNSITGKDFRLPTESEWEYAAKGGENSHNYKYSGSNNINEVGWYFENTNTSSTVVSYAKNKGTCNVKMKRPNELGIYDMSGNVWEWCQDVYESQYKEGGRKSLFSTERLPIENPQGGIVGDYRVIRGGSYRSKDTKCWVFYREKKKSVEASSELGFRLVY